MIIRQEPEIKHYGTPRHSGRYPWGSGGNETTRNRTFLDSVEMLKKDGLSEAQIAEGMGITTRQLRARKTIAISQERQDKINQAQRLRDTGMGYTAIAREMGLPNESSVRTLLEPGAKDKASILENTAGTLQKAVDEKGLVDIGSGNEVMLDVSSTKFDAAVAILQEKGYEVHSIPITQLGTGKPTYHKVLAPPGTTWADVAKNKDKIQPLTSWNEDGGRPGGDLGIQYPMSISSKRVAVRYKEDGGAEADGVIYVRPGVKDISIGASQYAQVRIAVDDSHYLKGMAMYKDDLPDGVDLMFNTNKSNTGNKLDSMKEFKKLPDGSVDRENPFGAYLKRQIIESDGGKERLTSVMNIVREEGDWETWSRSLSSQILSKQDPKLIKQQLDLTYENKRKALDEINSLTNPTVKKALLEKFADGADSASVHLKAATLPGSSYHVILPVSSMKPTEVYAPNFRNGDRVALIRSPHGGTFEIPELTVNNRNREASKLLGPQSVDAVGIHHSVAERLSGADFDGDFVIVVPNNDRSIKSTPALEGLKDFDPKASFPHYEGMKVLEGKAMQRQMGEITNLIADMTLRGANATELASAVRHSMVVIDAEKHKLDASGSFRKNNIAALKQKYQGSARGGAKTLITKASSEERVPERKLRKASQGGPIDKATGEKVYVPTGRMIPVRNKVTDPVTGKVTYVDTGKTKLKEDITTKLAVAKDARDLSSGTPQEELYAAYSNRTKALANTARKEMVGLKTIPYSPSAKAAYSNEVASLDAKLRDVKRNRPLERQAQVIANAVVSQRRQANPGMEPDEVKKIKRQALSVARNRTGAAKQAITFTQAEWNAIQAGAISNHQLEELLRASDIDSVRKLALPKEPKKMTSTKTARAKSMLASGYTQAEVARALGVSLTTLKTGLSDG